MHLLLPYTPFLLHGWLWCVVYPRWPLRLRYEVWKRDEAGRQLHADVDSITLMFTQALAG